MNTKQLLKEYMKISGASQQSLAQSIGVNKVSICKFLSDTNSFELSADTQRKLHYSIIEKINQLNELIK